ncbi:MAG: GNAT family N-acetyltransferase [Candidatus Eremiobacteraeota bacterium]|nr:GNAT family N-acetyltransferase [Candidatus Eremiobacteraeota bacterium]MCW5868975.1 GNAT family N-acetyltransferase [Candidatus Eremiobacteraeota bacterium]
MIEYRPLAVCLAGLEEARQLLQEVFPRSKQFTPDYMHWMYTCNPAGPAIGYNAYCDNQLVAHVAAHRLYSSLGSQFEPGILLHNVATRPEFQGKGIFKKLLHKCFESARTQGCTHMLAVPNSNSTPGFVRSLKCQFVGSLSARIVLGKPHFQPVNLEYQRIWPTEQLKWRLSWPGRRYSSWQRWILGNTGMAGLRALLSYTPREDARFCSLANWLERLPIYLWIGLDPTLNWRGTFYWEIPLRLRPAPLNLVFLDLTAQQRILDPAKVAFCALDFDIY